MKKARCRHEVKQIDKYHIIKKRQQVEIFACRRYLIKFFNNTQLHKHIEKHHAKKLSKVTIKKQ